MLPGIAFQDHPDHPSSSFSGLHRTGSTRSINDRHLEPPHTYEALLAANASLRTRVTELEVINDLFRGRVAELEQEANAKKDESIGGGGGGGGGSEDRLRGSLEEACRRETELKRRLEEVEQELTETGPRAKKMRVSDIVDEDDGRAPSTPQSTTTPSV